MLSTLTHIVSVNVYLLSCHGTSDEITASLAWMASNGMTVPGNQHGSDRDDFCFYFLCTPNQADAVRANWPDTVDQ